MDETVGSVNQFASNLSAAQAAHLSTYEVAEQSLNSQLHPFVTEEAELETPDTHKNHSLSEVRDKTKPGFLEHAPNSVNKQSLETQVEDSPTKDNIKQTPAKHEEDKLTDVEEDQISSDNQPILSQTSEVEEQLSSHAPMNKLPLTEAVNPGSDTRGRNLLREKVEKHRLAISRMKQANTENSSQQKSGSNFDVGVTDTNTRAGLEGGNIAVRFADTKVAVRFADASKDMEGVKLFTPESSKGLKERDSSELPNLFAPSLAQHSLDFSTSYHHSQEDGSFSDTLQTATNKIFIPEVKDTTADVVPAGLAEEGATLTVKKLTPSFPLPVKDLVGNTGMFQDGPYQADTGVKQTSSSTKAGGIPAGEVELKSFQVITGQKEFIVEQVKGSELTTIQTTTAEKSSIRNSPFILNKTSSYHSDKLSAKADFTNQDTIGPLDNPVFLKSLMNAKSFQPSSAQPPNQDEPDVLTFSSPAISLTSLRETPNLDQGWAWVILFAAVISALLLGATIYASGVLILAILKDVDPDLMKVSWVGSLFVCSMCFSSPLVDVVMKRCGARITVFCAGIVMSSGFMGASFSTNIYQLILTHGFISGVGAGFVLSPMTVTVGQYFQRYRGLACGFMATGAGAGMLSGGSLFSLLVDYYGLKGAYMFWSGVLLHTAVMGLLLRPSPQSRPRKRAAVVTQQVGTPPQRVYAPRETAYISSFPGSMNQSMISGLDKAGLGKTAHSTKNRSKINSPGSLTAYDTVSGSMAESERATPQLSNYPHQQKKPKTKYILRETPESNDQQYKARTGSSLDESRASKDVDSRPASTKPRSSHKSSTSVDSMPLTSDKRIKMAGNTWPSSPASLNSEVMDKKAVPMRPASPTSPSLYSSTYSKHYKGMDGVSVSSALVSRQLSRDVLAQKYPIQSASISTFMGSMANMPTSLVILKDDVSRLEASGLIENPNQIQIPPVVPVKRSGCVGLLKQKSFSIFLGVCFLWSLGESPVMIYLPSYAISKGTSPMQASLLYTAMGSGSILGRFMSALVATDKKVGPVVLFAGCMGVAGLLVILSPFMTDTLVGQMTFSCLAGLYTGSLVPLSSLVVLEMLELRELGMGLGLFNVAQGTGYLVGPPLASIFVTVIGYEKAFMFSGCILMIGSFLAMTIPAFMERDEDEEAVEMIINQSVESDNETPYQRVGNSTEDS